MMTLVSTHSPWPPQTPLPCHPPSVLARCAGPPNPGPTRRLCALLLGPTPGVPVGASFAATPLGTEGVTLEAVDDEGGPPWVVQVAYGAGDVGAPWCNALGGYQVVLAQEIMMGNPDWTAVWQVSLVSVGPAPPLQPFSWYGVRPRGRAV